MSSFHLQIVTPDGLFYDGQAESLNLRAAQGGLTILPRHTNFVTTVGMGPAKVVLEGKSRIAACIGGAGFMEYYVQRHGDLAAFSYSIMSACLLAAAGLILLLRKLAQSVRRR